MRKLMITLTAVVLTVPGCATGLRVGGNRAGVEAGAAVGPARPTVLPPVATEEPPRYLPPPPTR